MGQRIIVLIAIVLGEIAMIFTEITIAHLFQLNVQSYRAIWKLVVLVTVGAWILLAGYALGLIAYRNVWVISAISITSILIAEPLLAYKITGQVPTTGGLVGFTLGAAGLIVALLW
jgi:hypothetical protein